MAPPMANCTQIYRRSEAESWAPLPTMYCRRGSSELLHAVPLRLWATRAKKETGSRRKTGSYGAMKTKKNALWVDKDG